MKLLSYCSLQRTLPSLGERQKGFAHILLLILIVAGIGLGIYLVQNRTNIFPQAASEPIGPFTGFTFLPSKDTVPQGSEFKVKVLANSDFDAANLFTLVMDYPTNLVEVVGLEPSEATPGGTFVKKWIEQSVNNGKVTLSGAVPNPGLKTVSGTPETMAIITFRVYAASGKISLSALSDSAIYRNSDSQNIISANKNASISIGAQPSTSGVPAVDSDSDGFLDGEELFYGTDPNKSCGVNSWPPDLNDDSVINGGDVSSLVPYTSGAKPYSKRYDLNRDGSITQDDVTVIQKFFLKSCSLPSPTPTPSCKPRPACLDANPRCLIPVTSDMCPPPAPTPTPLPPAVDGKRADLFKDSKKPNFVNDQDISVFYSKCAEKGIELFGQPASVQPICDIFEDGKITVQDWAVLIKFRNSSI